MGTCLVGDMPRLIKVKASGRVFYMLPGAGIFDLCLALWEGYLANQLIRRHGSALLTISLAFSSKVTNLSLIEYGNRISHNEPACFNGNNIDFTYATGVSVFKLPFRKSYVLPDVPAGHQEVPINPHP